MISTVKNKRMKHPHAGLTLLIYHMGLFSIVLAGDQISVLFPAHCLLSIKPVVALISVTGESGAETIADKNSKTIQYIFPLI